ncbi:hypothetical protein IQ06DRAFT_303523 [Phaeosphaeriaceae sp. SRC1lsM3a]|nr:hypothetical protein IQ06DRAFT_303523 [Stagonospora sp. SRC1lsM3a]
MRFDLARWLRKSPKAMQYNYTAAQSAVYKKGVPRGFECRHVFETISGYFGFGPSWMKCGDQSVMFDGGVTPFIMRKTITKDKNEGGTWEFVGDCYLHLWMDGAYSGHAVVDQWVPTSKTGEKREAGEAGETEEAGEASKDEKPKFLILFLSFASILRIIA